MEEERTLELPFLSALFIFVLSERTGLFHLPAKLINVNLGVILRSSFILATSIPDAVRKIVKCEIEQSVQLLIIRRLRSVHVECECHVNVEA